MINEKQEIINLYNEVMTKVLEKSKDIILQAELIWIFKLSG